MSGRAGATSHRTRGIWRPTLRLWALSLVASVAVHGAILVTLSQLFSSTSSPPRIDLPKGGASGVRVFLLPRSEVESPAPATEIAAAPPPPGAVEPEAEPLPRIEPVPEPVQRAPARAARPSVAQAATAPPAPTRVATAAPTGAPALGSPGDDIEGGTAGVMRAPSPDARNRAPEYPEASRRRREQGDVLLHLVIQADGGVARVHVIRSSGHPALDEAAAQAAARWRFDPALQDGVAVASEVDVPIAFVLR